MLAVGRAPAFTTCAPAGTGAGSDHPVAVELVVERAPADPQELGGGGAVVPAPFQRRLQGLSLGVGLARIELGEGLRTICSGCAGLGEWIQGALDVVDPDARTVTEDDQALHQV